MSIFWGLENYCAPAGGTAVTIGTFDGLHRGHRALLSRLSEIGEEQGLPTLAITFDRHPLETVAPSMAPELLNTPRERAERLEGMGVGRVLVLEFDQALAAVEAEDFVRDVLVEKAGMRCCAVGSNFMFGRGRRGDAALIERIGREAGFTVEVVPPLFVAGEQVSSSAIRAAVRCGDMRRAARMLGSCYRVRGRVIPGDAKGRELGYPTANVQTDERVLLPADGVYAVNAVFNGMLLRGAANLGVRPTLGPGPRWLEVHIIGYSGDLYDLDTEVIFLERLRDEMRFESIDALIRQIKDDVHRALRTHDCLADEQELASSFPASS